MASPTEEEVELIEKCTLVDALAKGSAACARLLIDAGAGALSARH
jgi:hypothetical protein